MKVFHEEVSYKLEREDELISLLDSFKTAFIATTAQFKAVLEKISTKNKGLVLGCSVNIINNYKGDMIIFLGDGAFHALMIKLKNKDKKVFAVNPFSLKKKEITAEDVKRFEFREAVALDKLKTSKNVGVIISTKNGQSHTSEALKIKSMLELEGKNVYLFMFETINPDEFLNFPGIDCLVNTACPRLALDDYSKFPVPVINHASIR